MTSVTVWIGVHSYIGRTTTEEHDVTPQPATQIDNSSTYFFNARELARLAVYRAAVVARFYTDQCEPSNIRHSVDASKPGVPRFRANCSIPE